MQALFANSEIWQELACINSLLMAVYTYKNVLQDFQLGNSHIPRLFIYLINRKEYCEIVFFFQKNRNDLKIYISNIGKVLS